MTGETLQQNGYYLACNDIFLCVALNSQKLGSINC